MEFNETPFYPNPQSVLMSERTRSNWWFLLPIFLGVVGGLISYFVIRSDDPDKAKNNLYLGIALTVVEVAVSLAFYWILLNVNLFPGSSAIPGSD